MFPHFKKEYDSGFAVPNNQQPSQLFDKINFIDKINEDKIVMTNIIKLFLFLLFTSKVLACSCEGKVSLSENFMKSIFVAKIKILKKHKNEQNNEYYKADILIDDLYKGKFISSIFIYGNNGRNFDTSCDRFFYEGETAVVFLEKNVKGKLMLAQCSHVIRLRKDNDLFGDSFNREEFFLNDIKTLKYLYSKKITFTNNVNNVNLNFFYSFLGSLDLSKIKTHFAIYKLTISTDYKTKCFRKIKGFGRDIDKKVKKYIKDLDWKKHIKNITTPKKINYLIILKIHQNKEGVIDYLIIN